MDKFDNTVKKYTTWLDNEYVSSALMVFLIVYASLVAPKLPLWLAKLFDYTLFKFLIFFLIIYVSKHNATIALIAAVGLMVSLMALEHLKYTNELMYVVSQNENEHFSMSNLSSDSYALLNEVNSAKDAGLMQESEAKQVINKVMKPHKYAKSLLVTKTSNGAQQLSEIENAHASGNLSTVEAERLAAKVVIAEALSEVRNTNNNNVVPSFSTPQSTPIQLECSTSSLSPQNSDTTGLMLYNPSHLKSITKSELAQEILRRKQQEEQRRGVELTDDDVRHLCNSVLTDRYNFGADVSHNELSTIDYAPIQ